jgi:superfamily II DNA helicase RecQ
MMVVTGSGTAPDDVSRGYAAAVLECVDSIPFRVGKTKLARVLRGSCSQEILRMNADKLPQYGALRSLTIQQIIAIIDQLLNAGYLRSSFGRRPVVTLTSEGRAALLAGNLPPVEAPDALAMFMARERCRKCPYNPAMIGSSGAMQTVSGEVSPF